MSDTVLITGGAGFIGSHVVDKLLQEHYKVIVIDNLVNGSMDNIQEALANDNFTFVQGDILNKETVQQAMQDITYIFHLACLGVRHSIHSPFDNHRVNAEGTLNVLEAAKQAGVKHFFYISTSEIYGRTTTFPISEDASTNPLTVYGASKLAGEHYTNAFYECYGMPVTVFRIFNNYGPRAHYEGDAGEIIPRSLVRILYDQQPILFGDGSITRDFFFVKDTAEVLNYFLQMAKSEKQKEIIAQTYNIGNGNEITMRDLVEKLLNVMDKHDLGILYTPARPADVPRLWVKTDKFKTLTGFNPSYSFEDGLKETIKFYKNKMIGMNLLNGVKIHNWIK